MSRLLVVGDALLDRDVEGVSERLAPDAPVPVLERGESRARPGGAALAAAIAAREGRPAALVTALADDAAGRELARALRALGVELVGLPTTGETVEKIRFLDRGKPLMRLDRGGGTVACAGREPDLWAAIAAASAILVSDYGGGVTAAPEVRRALVGRPPGVPLVWDPHPRGSVPVPGADLATPNIAEALELAGAAPGPAPGPPADGLASPQALARALAVRWRAAWVCVTRGEAGATLAEGSGEHTHFAITPRAGDPCGAGDSFAAAAAWALAGGAGAEKAVKAASKAAAAFVEESGSRELAAAPGEQAETVVATGGCFDLLHVGHVRSLEAARGLGDRLVVLLNSDRSVRELKGPGRPVIAAAERAAMLRALACVDDVVVFDEPDPRAALERLRPDVWVKGGDYRRDELPEAKAIAAWGGRIEILPHLGGRSTTKLIEEVGERVAG